MDNRNIKIGIIGGSGLGDLANHILNNKREIKRESAKNDFGIPSSNLFEGVIAGVDVVLLSRHGVGHKILPTAVNYRANIESLRLAGCTHILACTACGSLSESIDRGDLVIPDSFIDRTVHRKNSFFDGSSESYSGIRHVPMEPAFDIHTSNVINEAAKKLGIPIKRGGTVVTIEGPRFSSKAESNMFRLWGGHVINMTTCPEVCLAKEASLLYATIGIVTDYDCWKDTENNVCVANVMNIFKSNITKVIKLLVEAVELIGKENWDNDIEVLKMTVSQSRVS